MSYSLLILHDIKSIFPNLWHFIAMFRYGWISSAISPPTLSYNQNTFHNPNCQNTLITHCHFQGFSQKCSNVIVVSINNNFPNSEIFDQFHLMGIQFLTPDLHLTQIWLSGDLNHAQEFSHHWQTSHPSGITFTTPPPKESIPWLIPPKFKHRVAFAVFLALIKWK